MSDPAAWLATPLQFLKGVGPRKAADFARAGLHSVEDLLCRFPRRYEDRSRLQSIASLREGQTVTISGDVITCGLRGTRRPGFRIFEALMRDPSGTVRLTWFNSAFLKDPDGYDLVVNATPLGMKDDDPLPMDVDRIAPTTFVADVVMKPRAVAPRPDGG